MLYYVSVYTIRGIDIPYVFFLFYMFRPDRVIFRYIRIHSRLFLFCYSPHTGQCLHMGVCCMYGLI
jgi:hypothetical protein